MNPILFFFFFHFSVLFCGLLAASISDDNDFTYSSQVKDAQSPILSALGLKVGSVSSMLPLAAIN